MTPKRGLKCDRCRQMQTRHAEPSPGVFHCDDGGVATFTVVAPNPTRQGTSYSADEIELLYAILMGAFQGRDLSVIVRSPVMLKLMRKATAMRAKSKEGNP